MICLGTHTATVTAKHAQTLRLSPGLLLAPAAKRAGLGQVVAQERASATDLRRDLATAFESQNRSYDDTTPPATRLR